MRYLLLYNKGVGPGKQQQLHNRKAFIEFIDETVNNELRVAIWKIKLIKWSYEGYYKKV
jgi:hypothetical protein